MKRFVYAAIVALFLAILSNQAVAGENRTTVACGTSTTVALAANAARTYAIFQNNSDTEIHVAVGGPATTNDISLNTGGASWELTDAFGNGSTSVVNCIHGGTGTKNLKIYEKDLR